MSQPVDQEVLSGFLDEAESYLPSILDGIAAMASDPDAETVKEAHRLTHTIAGAGAMVGLEELGQAAELLEEVLLDVAEGGLTAEVQLVDSANNLANEMQAHLNAHRAGEDPVLLKIAALEAAYGSAQDQNLPSTEHDPSEQAREDQQHDTEPLELVPELMEAFRLEAEEHLGQIASSLRALEEDPRHRGQLQQLQRTVHTLKGAAGVVGQSEVAQLSHRMEDLLDHLVESQAVIEADVLDSMVSSSDLMADLLHGEADPAAVEAQTARLQLSYAEMLAAATPSPEGGPHGQEEAESQKPTTPARQAAARETVRVPLERLDGLARLVTELVISRSVFEERLRAFDNDMRELEQSSERLRSVSSKFETDYEVRALGRRAGHDGGPILPIGPRLGHQEAHGFDELEFDRYTEFHLLTRELTEVTADIRTLSSEMAVLASEFDAIMKRQGRVSSDIQEALKRTRTVPVSTLLARLQRAVRKLAREQGKQVKLVLEGSHVELDKAILEALADPLLHLIRNAVDHGIEPAEDRQAIGKPEGGTIHVRAEQLGSEFVILVGDDGAGLDPDLVRSAAVAGEHLAESAAFKVATHDLHQMIFLPGLSTAGEVSQVSGRGIGLDIVKSSVRQLNGDVRVESAPGEGTWFTIRLPMTVAVIRALLVKAGNDTYAIPMNSLTRVLRVSEAQAERVENDRVVEDGTETYPALRLSEILGLPELGDDQLHARNVLLFSTGVNHLALQVEEIVGAREIVVKNLGPYLERVRGIAGASIMGDGSVVLILNPADLVDSPRIQTQSKAPEPVDAAPLVMIVDDSLSVRRVVSGLFESSNWESIQARDGVEALEMLQSAGRLPDVILVDIEMPRMDGYELMAALRSNAAYQNIPLVVLTSRAGEKHRRKAMEAGATDYITKPYQDEALLTTIGQLARASGKRVSA